MIYLSTVPSRKTVVHKALISQQLPVKYFTATANTQINLLFGMPAGYSVVGVKLALLTQFVVPTSTTFTVSVGLAGGSPYQAFYASAFQLMNVATPTTQQVTYTNFANSDNPLIDGAHDIYLYFVGNGGGYLANITQGELEVTVLYRSA
jgi:hypothetical protein